MTSQRVTISAMIIVACLVVLAFAYDFVWPVDTPPWLSGAPRPLRARFVVWRAYRTGSDWGQCEVCGFPVGTDDVMRGWGELASGVWMPSFRCVKHEVAK